MIGLVACVVGCGGAGKSHDGAALDAAAPDGAALDGSAIDGPATDGADDGREDADVALDAEDATDGPYDADAPAAADVPVASNTNDAPDASDANDAGDGDGSADGLDADAGVDADLDASLDASDDGPRQINVTASRTQLVHIVNGHLAALDNRSPRMLGKLVVSIGSSLSYLPYAGKRGFHLLTVNAPYCPFLQDWTHGMSYPGDCRANGFDGLPHGDQSGATAGTCIEGQVRSTLAMLKTSFATEDWGYFLDADGSVRWADVILTGFGDGGTAAARIGTLVAVDRVVVDTGVQDNACGTGAATTWPADGGIAPSGYYDASCVKFGSWLGDAPATPLERFFVFIGRQDAGFGNAMFSADHLRVQGPPRDIDITSPPYDGSHLFVHEAGHVNLVGTTTTTLDRAKALDLAFGVPFANQNPQF